MRPVVDRPARCVIIAAASDSRYPEGLNGLPAEAQVNPVFTGTGAFCYGTHLG
jgi:hypothetical protein